MQQHLRNLPAYLLALVFLVFGANFFLNFMPMPPINSKGAPFMKLLVSTHYLAVIKVLEIMIGVMLLVPKTRALAYILIAPIIFNIVLMELLISGEQGIGVLLLVLNIVGISLNKEKYMAIVN